MKSSRSPRIIRSTLPLHCELLEGRRLLSFSPAVNYSTIGTPSAIVTADFNNDGNLDLATCANAVTGSFSVLLGDGAGGFGAAQRTILAGYPTWMHAVWAVGVWGSALGAVLLLLRSKWAFHAFAVSLLGALGNLAYSAMNGQDPIFPAVIVVICAVFIWYAQTMTKRGVLR